MKRLIKIGGAIGCLLLAMSNAYALGTSAGTPIENRATVTYNAGAGTISADSDIVTFKVQELVKATIAKLDSGIIRVSSPQDDASMKFRIKNDGNGSEGFKIVVTQDSGDHFDVTLGNIYIDDGDGILDTAIDTLYNNSSPPAIAADGSIVIWVTSKIPPGFTNNKIANLNVSAVSHTFILDNQSNPNAGDVVIGGGDNSTDAVNAIAVTSVTSTYQVSDINVSITKAVTATRDNLGAGGNKAVPGAEVDYLLTVTVSGSGIATDVVVSDPLPPQLQLKNGTTGSITVSGTPLTAASGDDAASYDANTNTISVELSDMEAGVTAPINIEFTTVIQ